MLFNDRAFSGFAFEVIGEFDDFGEVPSAFLVLSAFAMGAKREDAARAKFVELV
ncbi:hypothetical protein ACKWRH_06790 [Bradyrhizobium sp. Pa8]|uniref:hypothetical protein n=1 Tax=Bradyrhizobium sp. Pa8 TaxID=3386552 RepID=UPI00403F9880